MTNPQTPNPANPSQTPANNPAKKDEQQKPASGDSNATSDKR